MNSKRTVTIAVLAVSAWLASAAATWAQHHHDGHGGAALHGRGHFGLISPYGHHVTDHHDLYHHVVPFAPHFGLYYTYENIHYYTPPAPPVVVGRPVVLQRPLPVDFGGFRHYEQLAQRLETLANQFCLDLHYNYQHNRNFAQSYREAYQLLQAAKYLHGSEHRGDREALRRSARDIDNWFHHVQGEVQTWSRVERRPVGQLGIGAKLEEMESLIHHLLFDLGVKPDHGRAEVTPPPAEEIAPPPADGPPPLPRPVP